MAIYMQYEGLKGNVTAEGYTDHIDIQSMTFGVGRGISMDPGNLANREATRPSISEITVTKLMDNSTTSLFKESVTGSNGKKVLIKFVRTGADKVNEFMNYELEDCLVSGYNVSSNGDSQPIETITLSFSKILINHTDNDATNKSGSPARVGYDLGAAKPL